MRSETIEKTGHFDCILVCSINQTVQLLQPDLVLLDIGKPRLNGIEAARRIREVSPKCKILFLSEDRSWDIVEEGLRTGAKGYVVKSDAAGELIPAMQAVLNGSRFVSARLSGDDLSTSKSEHGSDHAQREGLPS